MSVDGSNGQGGALVRLPDASPETITEETQAPSATVTPLSTVLGMDVARLDLGRDRAQDQVLSGTGVNHSAL